MGHLGCGPVAGDLLHAPHSSFDGRDGPCLSIVFIDCSSWEMNVNQLLPQGEPEFKYFLQGGMSRKESLLAKPSGPLDT